MRHRSNVKIEQKWSCLFYLHQEEICEMQNGRDEIERAYNDEGVYEVLIFG